MRERSELMGRIRSVNTKPEMRVRRLVHGMGYRYRLHAKDLPGRPDLVFRPRRKVIFVHGCFWHRHRGCSNNRMPKSPERLFYWRKKLDGNAQRDREHYSALRSMGWQVLVIWECETKEPESVKEKVRAFLKYNEE
ncbi:MAG: very short patch repair endonuclease [Gemmatimonadetes bacterium]|nr:very short patch repair endonuclease [Gemmatimonadota bacterium]